MERERAPQGLGSDLGGVVAAHWMAVNFPGSTVREPRLVGGELQAWAVGYRMEASCWVPTQFPRKVLLRHAAELVVKPLRTSPELNEKLPWESAACWAFQESS